ncbi:DUF1648 domain-containing protein [Brevibacillus fortis]|uniref:DUF1648 domain-containing protein n=1 Tax=Brevibacillus fortis TaxID=2126352 RepID=A0A2P7UPG2_9BACL|nr:DUF1648 domain-containing protein [Brevibacillus fortis]MED1783129.1 DUF1648 domain-containing protein [Brevibacillus fortis]PSJ88890.1 hypothetical protein C7R93_23920 [Brevibacillus fortis]
MKRPIIKIPKTGSEWLWDVVGFLFFVGSILFLVFAWNKLPDEVPAHYNALGEVDRWGSKWELLLLAGIGVFIIFLMQVLEKHPELHNYPARFQESNAKQFYLHSRKIVNQIKNSCLIIFSVILLESVSIALGWGGGIGKWFLPITIIGMIVLLVIGIVKQKKIQ